MKQHKKREVSITKLDKDTSSSDSSLELERKESLHFMSP